MNATSELPTPTAVAATGETKAAAAPRIKLSSHGFSIDHPDPELGEQLLANALGVADREAIALLLGFEDANSFVRAFRGWTGTTPQVVRRNASQFNSS